MAKERIHVTVDPDVKRDLDHLDSVNVSGAVNNFLRQYLDGETGDRAETRVEIERKREKAEELRGEATRLEREADAQERILENRESERRDRMEKAVEHVSLKEMRSVNGPVVTNDEEQLETLAQMAEVSPEELVAEAKQRYDEREPGAGDPTYQ